MVADTPPIFSLSGVEPRKLEEQGCAALQQGTPTTYDSTAGAAEALISGPNYLLAASCESLCV